MKTLNKNIVLVLIIIAVGILAFTSYKAGYNRSKNEMGSLLMTMSIDSNFVTTGLYEELPNNVRKTMQFYIEETPTIVNNIKLYAEVKYVTIGDEVINIDNGKMWNLIKKEKVFQRQFNKEGSDNEKKDNPNSSLVQNENLNSRSKNIL